MPFGSPQRPSHYRVAVRALCDYAARQGDLDLRFSPSPTSQQGIAGHQSVAARRGAGYQAEVAVSGEYRHLSVRGRADGFDLAHAKVEEIKTFKGDLQRMPANHRALHWAQAKVYGHLLCRLHGLASMTVALVYFDVGQQQEAEPLLQHCSAAELQAHFETLCESFIAWADQELAHRAARDDALTALQFPFDGFRTGQRELSKGVYNAARLGSSLMAQAPTGIGKTMATVFGFLKACPGQQIDKIYYLTAKGSGRGLALQAVQTLRSSAPALSLRVLDLASRDKACEHPDKVCHGDSCPLARGFYDRLPAARSAAVASADTGTLTQAALRDVALAHEVCPYHLGQEMARWSDLVVGDYNHYFDSSALLHALAVANDWRVAVLVDEAHNLLERARAMYSAELSPLRLREARAVAPDELKKPLDRLQRSWRKLAAGQTEPYQVQAEPPASFVAALQDATASITATFEARPVGLDRALLEFYFDALQFGRLLETFGTHSIFDVTLEGAERGGRRVADATLCLRNVVPAPFLKPRYAAARASVLFSATLTPRQFYADTLGLGDDTTWLDVQTPFSADQLSVHIAREVSTRYTHRADSLQPIARLIAKQYAARPGNYLAFFSSFDYLQRAHDAFAAGSPEVPTWQQDRRMAEPQRDAFLARFEPDGRGIGFAVLGGLFAEGIDLQGSRLIGAFIATLGLPQINPVNEELRRRMQATFGAGYDYTYLYPGIRKVVQAAGRVIRTPCDRGSLHLIDDRFARPEIRRLLPDWWHIEPALA